MCLGHLLRVGPWREDLGAGSLTTGRVNMGLRDRIRGGDGHAGRRYRMQEKLLSIGDDYWIEDETGQRVFKVDGKAVRSAPLSCSRTRRAAKSRRSKNAS